MKRSLQRIYLLSGFLFLSVFSNAQPENYISLKQKTDIIENRKKISSEVDLFFDKNKNIIIKYYHSPTSFIMITNSLGEIKIYYPASNEVAYKQVAELSSKRNLIYYFANNLIDNLGLVDEGFKMTSNTIENQFYVTQWKAPIIFKDIETVKIVSANGIPLYAEYLTIEKKIVKKIYYTNYKDFTQFRLPLKIIDISYPSSGDSIVNRTIFSNVKVSSKAEDQYFNFKIPDDAKPLSDSHKK
jgi:hypothetical protein